MGTSMTPIGPLSAALSNNPVIQTGLIREAKAWIPSPMGIYRIEMALIHTSRAVAKCYDAKFWDMIDSINSALLMIHCDRIDVNNGSEASATYGHFRAAEPALFRAGAALADVLDLLKSGEKIGCCLEAERQLRIALKLVEGDSK